MSRFGNKRNVIQYVKLSEELDFAQRPTKEGYDGEEDMELLPTMMELAFGLWDIDMLTKSPRPENCDDPCGYGA